MKETADSGSNATPSVKAAASAAVKADQWLQPSPAIMIGKGERRSSGIDSNEPDASEANSKAAAAPAPRPINTNCIITSCPAPFRAVRDGTIPSQPSVPGVTPATSRFRLLNYIRQQAEEARAFDRLRQFALLLGRHRGDTARYDLAALRDVALQQLDVLVVDLRRVGAGERAGLAPAEEGTAGAAAKPGTLG